MTIPRTNIPTRWHPQRFMTERELRGYRLTDPRLWLLIGVALILGAFAGIWGAALEYEHEPETPVVPVLFRVGLSMQGEPFGHGERRMKTLKQTQPQDIGETPAPRDHHRLPVGTAARHLVQPRHACFTAGPMVFGNPVEI